MSNYLAARVVFCSAHECDVDVPNEFITIRFCNLSGRGSSRFERWSSDSLARPSQRAARRAHELAIEAFSKQEERL